MSKTEVFVALWGDWFPVIAEDSNFYLTVDPDGLNHYHIKVLAKTKE